MDAIDNDNDSSVELTPDLRLSTTDPDYSASLSSKTEKALDKIDRQIISTAGIYASVFAIGFFTLPRYGTPATLSRRRWVLGLATSTSMLDELSKLYCNHRAMHHILGGRDEIKEYRSTGDIYTLLYIFRALRKAGHDFNTVTSAKHIKLLKADLDYRWNIMEDMSISKQIYYSTSYLWSLRTSQAIIHGLFLPHYEESGVSIEDSVLASLQLANAYHQDFWTDVRGVSYLGLLGGGLMELWPAGNKYLLRLSAGIIATSMINLALCCARRFQLDEAPHMFGNKDKVAAAFRSFNPKFYK